MAAVLPVLLFVSYPSLLFQENETARGAALCLLGSLCLMPVGGGETERHGRAVRHNPQ